MVIIIRSIILLVFLMIVHLLLTSTLLHGPGKWVSATIISFVLGIFLFFTLILRKTSQPSKKE